MAIPIITVPLTDTDRMFLEGLVREYGEAEVIATVKDIIEQAKELAK